ncbi:uncharacterized protein PG986_012962 [Apiospora aurea]|uniref:Uncharacterized protein n=1 Tax=Apiospora aurea TaxID=335848 RepID=A0ABR1Q1I0_9PEZI
MCSIGGWAFGFHHFQLVMNEHFYGPGRGLHQPIFEPKWEREGSIWHMKPPKLTILDDQCFLSAQYEAYVDDGTPTQVRTRLSQCHQVLRFCFHFDQSPWRTRGPDGRIYPRRLPELQTLWNAGEDRVDEPAREYSSQGSCPICLTDYTFEVKRCPGPHPTPVASQSPETYLIKIVTYQQLGACRTPDDWMWQAFAKISTTREPHLVTRLWYIDSDHKPGAVKRRWELGHVSEDGQENPDEGIRVEHRPMHAAEHNGRADVGTFRRTIDALTRFDLIGDLLRMY